MPAKQFADTDSFLKHSTRSKKTSFVKDWKKEVDDQGQHSLIAWLHMKQRPFSIWVHGFPKILIKKGEDGEETRYVVWGKYNCHEEEDVLKDQFKTSKETGDRIVPPRVCGMCLFIEWVRGQVRSGALPWTKPIFRFDHENPLKTIIIHAAGLYNGFRGDLTKEQKDELRDAGISQERVWGENAQAKCEYMITIVDNKHPENGPAILHESALVGDKLKDVLADQRESLGAEKGDPWIHPYPIKFIYLPDESPMKKYKARALSQMPLTPLIQNQINGDPPDLSRQIAPFNPKELRTFLETHCLLKNVPWDEIFSKHTHAPEQEHQESDHESEEEEESTAPASSKPSIAEDADMVACDQCEKPMKASDTKCANCGAEYEVESAAPPPPPPPNPPLKKRSEMKKDKVPF